MPYNWNMGYIPSKADKSIDILEQIEIEISGMGQFIYYPFRYKDYILTNGIPIVIHGNFRVRGRRSLYAKAIEILFPKNL